MKKNLVTIVFCIIFIICLIIYFVYQLYSSNSCSSQDNPNSHLITIGYAVQIGYNVVYLIIAVFVLGVAYFQLGKTSEATTVQTLINLDYSIRSDDFLKKRKKLAELVIINKSDTIKTWLEQLTIKHELTVQENENLACLKNIFEAVIYQFELIGHFYKKHIFNIEDVYQLFSVEVVSYWVLMSETGYIDYLRKKEHEDYYDKFENLYNDILKQEIINSSSNWLVKFLSQLYFWKDIYRIFYEDEGYRFKNNNNKISRLSNNIRKRIPLFLLEEKNLTL